MRWIRTASIAWFLSLPGAAFAQNLLVAPDFDVAGDVAAWPDPFPDPNLTISWAAPPMDVDGSASSGSLRLVTRISNGAADGPEQCFVSGPGIVYRAEGAVFVATQTPQPFPYLLVDYHASADCTGPQLGSDSEFPAADLDVWKPIAVTVTTPPGTGSVGFRAMSGNTVDPTPATAFFDALFLPEPEPLAGAVAAAIALLALGRRSPRARRVG